MKDFIKRKTAFLRNKWFKFSVVTFLYLLWFVVWSQIWWSLLGVAVIYDVYISKYYMKLFWGKHLKLKEGYKTYKSIAGWVEAIVFAVVMASLFRIYFVEMYVIPSSSMEGTLLVGDYLGVSKVAYGPKLPNTPLSIPFVHNTNPFNPEKNSYSEAIKMPYRRLAGFGDIKNGDIVVFNFPEGDTVALVAPQADYHDLVRQYGRDYVWKQSKVVSRPVDKRDNYIKRAVAIPGDLLEVRGGVVYINGSRESNIPTRQYIYNVSNGGVIIPTSTLDEMGFAKEDIVYFPSNGSYQLPLNAERIKQFKKLNKDIVIERATIDDVNIGVFPHDTTNFKWSVDNFGPLTIPKRDGTVALTVENLPLYERIIRVYEGNDLKVQDSVIYINGEKADKYTFKMNYYFMMGDNRHNSLDSRYWGFVPEDHVVGKASFVWLSIDRTKKFPRNIRFDRMFRAIKAD